MNENHIHVLKQYLKGKKDNIYLILIPLREFILEKCEKYNVKFPEKNTLISKKDFLFLLTCAKIMKQKVLN